MHTRNNNWFLKTSTYEFAHFQFTPARVSIGRIQETRPKKYNHPYNKFETSIHKLILTLDRRNIQILFGFVEGKTPFMVDLCNFDIYFLIAEQAIVYAKVDQFVQYLGRIKKPPKTSTSSQRTGEPIIESIPTW